MGVALQRRAPAASMALVFLSFAMPASLIGVVWPEVRERFGQSLGTLGFVGFVYGMGRMATSASGRRLIVGFGIGRAVMGAMGALVTACALTAVAPVWAAYLAGIAAVGMVSGVLDSLGAAFITRLGDVRQAGLIHGCYGVGATIAPVIAALTGSWRATMGAVAAWAAVALWATARVRHSWPGDHAHHAAARADTSKLPVLAAAHALALYLVFVGLEVTVGTWTLTYLTDHREVGKRLAAVAVSTFWAGITVGRLSLSRHAVSSLVGRLGLPVFVGVSITLMASLALLPAVAAVGVLLLLGMSLSPVIPSLLASTSARLGAAHAERMAGYQLLAANVGAIGFPALTGALVNGSGAGVVLLVTVPLAAAGVGLLVRA